MTSKDLTTTTTTLATKCQAMRIALILLIIPITIANRSSALSIDQKPVPNNLALTTITQDTSQSVRYADSRRPIWVLAHMVNSIKELDYRLSKGANAVEADVTFNREGVPLYTYHGPPCDCWRHCHQQESFNDYLAYVREIAISNRDNGQQLAPNNNIGQNLSLLFLDLKLDSLSGQAKALAGQELAKSVMSQLFVGTPTGTDKPFRLILSVNHVNDIDLINNFIHTLEINNSSQLMVNQIGFDVGMNDDLQLIETMWRRFGNTLNLWQGDGYTNCLSPFYNLERLSRALSKRDSSTGYPAKVYHWTIDLHDRVRESLLMGVDAIMTNHPERVLTILREPEIAHNFRLASRDDSPFVKLSRRVAGRSSETARFQRSANSNSGGFLGNLVDILTSWYNYLREIPFLSLPTTLVASSNSRLSSQELQKSKRQQQQQQLNPTSPATLVKLDSVPAYKIENLNFTSATNTETLDRSSVASGQVNGTTTPTDNQNIGVESPPPPPPPYEGPKWYVSLISNLLLSAVKIILPS